MSSFSSILEFHLPNSTPIGMILEPAMRTTHGPMSLVELGRRGMPCPATLNTKRGLPFRRLGGPNTSIKPEALSELSSRDIFRRRRRRALMNSISATAFLPYSSDFLFNANRLAHRKRIMGESPTNPKRYSKALSFRGGTTAIVGAMHLDRREILYTTFGILVGGLWKGQEDEVAVASDFADMPALRGKDYGKTKMRYPDYSETESGLQYKDLRVGSGPSPEMGETVVVDWDGYTIGYLGRIFEARNKAKGGPFEGGDKEFFKFKLGSRQVIPAFEEAVAGMSVGGIRRIVVPPELGYPDNDFNKLGPRPMSFSGQRHLDFVLKNEGLIDKTLLFDIELIKIVPN